MGERTKKKEDNSYQLGGDEQPITFQLHIDHKRLRYRIVNEPKIGLTNVCMWHQ